MSRCWVPSGSVRSTELLTTPLVAPESMQFSRPETGRLRDRTRAPPLVEGLVAVRRDLLRTSQKLDTPLVILDLVERSVELGGLAVGRKDIVPEEITDTALSTDVRDWRYRVSEESHEWTDSECDAHKDQAQIEALLCRPRRFLGSRQLAPRYEAIVIEGRDLATSGGRGAARPKASLCGICSRSK
jgi:hypothetical protein